MDYIDTFFEAWRDAGQALLLETVRHGLRERCPTLAKYADQLDAFDPMAFVTLLGSAPHLHVEQCVWGLLPRACRPVRTWVRAFADGRVLLPGVGFLRGAPTGQALELVDHGGRPVIAGYPELAFEAFASVAHGAKPTFYPYGHPPVRPFLELHGQHFDEVEVAGPLDQNRGALAEGWALLARAWPEQIIELDRDLRMVMIVRHSRVNSMAAPGIHGAIFLNTRGRESPLFFVEELVHQGGHVTFCKVIADWQAFLAIPYETPISILTGDDSDPRSFGDAFHGNYTMVRMVQSFARLFDVEDALDPALAHELRGRMTLGLKRLAIGLQQIEHPRLYTADGWSLHRRLAEAWTDVERRHGGFVRDYDVSDQPYVFDPARFIARNPAP